MKRKWLIVWVCSCCILSCCSPVKKDAKQVQLQSETPDVLKETKMEYKLHSVTRDYDADIIVELFREAVHKDPALKAIARKFDELRKMQSDSLESYRKYVMNNKQYWASVHNYIGKLSDSTFRKRVGVYFDSLEIRYQDQIKEYKEVMDTLNGKIQILKDQETLLQLYVTQPMMKNYARNEKPGIQPLKSVIKRCDSLIREAETYLKVNP